MRETLQDIVSLQRDYSSRSTPEMRRRGVLVWRTLPDELRRIGPSLRTALGPYGGDADAEGRDHTGRRSRIPWVRWHSKSLSPSATNGWYVVYLFHPEGLGVSLCLSHGSTKLTGSTFVGRGDAEVAGLMDWATGIVGSEFSDEHAVRHGIALGKFKMARAYERTTLFSKFYADAAIPSDADLEADLVRFMRPLARLYRAKESGFEPEPPSPDSTSLRDEVEAIISPLKRPRKGQGRGLSTAARKAVELAAMDRARLWLREKGFEFRDVSTRDCCDFRARRDGQDWAIEVKGTTGGPGSVLLTRNEVRLHRASHPLNVLLVVHGLSVSEDGKRATGGELIAFFPWKLEDERLSATAYEYRLR